MQQQSRGFLRKVVTDRSLPVTSLLVTVAGWLTAFVLSPQDGMGGTLAALLLYLVAGCMLVAVNYTFVLIRPQSFVQMSVFLVLLAVYVPLHRLSVGVTASLCFILALYALFMSYQRTDAPVWVFRAFVVIGLCTVFVPRFSWLVPLFWFGASLFRSMSLKGFVASVLGWLLPFWFLSAYAALAGDAGLLLRPLEGIIVFETGGYGMLLSQWPLWAYATLLFVVCSSHCMTTSSEDKIQERCYLQFLSAAGAFSIVLTLLQPRLSDIMLPILLLCTGMLCGRFMTTGSSRSSNVFFIVMTVLLVPLFLYNMVWMHL